MEEKDIKELIKRKESQDLEFKASLSRKNEIGETISAFANTNDGLILVGVSDEGETLGVDIGKRTLEDLANSVKENTDPQIYPNLKTYQVNSVNIVEISVKESDEKPVFFKDRAFQRVGKTNQRISSNKIRELAKQEKVKLYWDERICERANLEDIDAEKVRRFLRRARYERRLDIDPDITFREALERLELTRNGRITNAAVLLFGKNPQRLFYQAETRCGRFKGIKPIEFIDMKDFGGSIIDQREDAVEFVKEHIKLHVKIVGTERVETWEYPIEAVREAITNAICHRDYEMSANVQVRIFDDRVEIWGCGSLPEPLTVEDLKRVHRSVLRNRLIGKCFFLIKFIERWGTGTNRIISSCLDHGLPEPVFEEISGGLVVVLRREVTEEFLRGKGLNERQIRAVTYVREKVSISNKKYQDLLGVSRTTATRDLRSLVEKGILRRTGSGKRDLNYVLK
jgi:ATP-dependent DNA helicase RecG